jgi:hypothetical protein
MKLPQLTLRELFWLVLVVALSLGWWLSWSRFQERQRQLLAENEALSRANAWNTANFKSISSGRMGFSQPEVVVNRCQTPEEFVIALREVKDRYEFNDKIADAFAKTPIADQAIPALIDLLRDSDLDVRTRAASSLGKIKRQPDVIVPALISALDDEVPNVRWHAAYALRQFGPDAKAAIPALRKAIESSPPAVAIDGMEALKQIDPAAEIEQRLLPYLESEDEDLRLRAVGVLRTHGAAAGKAALVAAFERETKSNIKDIIALTIAAIDERLVRQDNLSSGPIAN